MTMQPTFVDLIEARRQIHDADALLLGRRGHVSEEVVSEIMAKHREVSVLITRYLQSRGVMA